MVKEKVVETKGRQGRNNIHNITVRGKEIMLGQKCLKS